MLKRDVYQKLSDWKEEKNKKALCVIGAYVKIGLNQEKPYKTRV